MAHDARRLGVQTGGAVGPGKIYIHRPIYDKALASLREGELCTIFDTRQVGKTSLVTRLVRGLEESAERHVTVYMELAGMLGGADTTAAWFRAFAWAIWTELAPRLAAAAIPPGDEDDLDEQRYQLEKSLRAKFGAWWEERDDAPAQRLVAFFEALVAPELDRLTERGHLVIFVDEVDAVLTKRFSDAFFLLVRAMYNDRAVVGGRRRASQRICFCLVGAITPRELVKADVTPFIVGNPLALTDFDRRRGDDLTELARFLAPTPDEAGLAMGNKRLDAVFSWTGGHPFLTMTLAAHIQQSQTPLSAIDDEVKTLVAHSVSPDRPIQTGRGTHLATHFAWINTYLADEKRAPNRVGIYKLYRRIVKRGHGPDNYTADSQVLKLAGIVKKRADGRLVIRNRLYRVALHNGWLRVVVAREPWTTLALAAAGGVVGTLMLMFIVWSYLQREAQKSADEHATRFREALARIETARDVPNATKAAQEAFRLLGEPDPARAVTETALDDAIAKFWDYPSGDLRQRGAEMLLSELELDRAKGLLLLLAAELVAGRRDTLSFELDEAFRTKLSGLVERPELLVHTLRGHSQEPASAVWVNADTIVVTDGANLYRWTLSTGQHEPPLALAAKAPTIAHAGFGWLCVTTTLVDPSFEPFQGGEQRVLVLRPRGRSYDELPALHIAGSGVTCRASGDHIEIVSANGGDLQWVTGPEGSLSAPWSRPQALRTGAHPISQVNVDLDTGLLVGTSRDWGATVWNLDDGRLVPVKQFVLEKPVGGDFTASTIFDGKVAVAGNRLQIYSLSAPRSLLWDLPEGRWWDSVTLGKRGVLLAKYAVIQGSRRVAEGVEMFVGNTPRVTLRRTSADVHSLALWAGEEAGGEAFAMSNGADKTLRVWTLDADKQRVVDKTPLAEAWVAWQLALGLTLDDALTPVPLGDQPARPATSIAGAHQQTIQRALTR